MPAAMPQYLWFMVAVSTCAGNSSLLWKGGSNFTRLAVGARAEESIEKGSGFY